MTGAEGAIVQAAVAAVIGAIAGVSTLIIGWFKMKSKNDIQDKRLDTLEKKVDRHIDDEAPKVREDLAEIKSDMRLMKQNQETIIKTLAKGVNK